LPAKPASEKQWPVPAATQTPQTSAPLHVVIQGQQAAARIKDGAPIRSIFIKSPEAAPSRGWTSCSAATFTIMLAVATAVFYRRRKQRRILRLG
jgi:hypothetical protein